MRDSFEPLIPLNGCKGTTFPVNFQIFGQKSFKVALFSTSMLPFATKTSLKFHCILSSIGSCIYDVSILYEGIEDETEHGDTSQHQ